MMCLKALLKIRIDIYGAPSMSKVLCDLAKVFIISPPPFYHHLKWENRKWDCK